MNNAISVMAILVTLLVFGFCKNKLRKPKGLADWLVLTGAGSALLCPLCPDKYFIFYLGFSALYCFIGTGIIGYKLRKLKNVA